MSSDRTCMMSDLNRVERQLDSKISSADAAARKAEKNAATAQAEMKKTDDKVKKLAGEMSGLAGDVAGQRRQLHRLDEALVELDAQQQADRRLIERNRQLIGDLAQDLNQVDRKVAANRQRIEQAQQHLDVLQHEMDVARQRIAQNERHIRQLDQGVRQINDRLEAERRQREAERQARQNDLDAQERLAADLSAQVEPARARFFGAYNEYLGAVAILDQARLNRQKGNLEAAIAQYQQGQSSLLKVARDVDERERAFENKRSQLQAALNQLAAELNLLDGQEMRTWYPAEFEQLQKRFQAAQQSFGGKQYELAGEPVEVRAALEQLNLQAAQIYQDMRLLEGKLLATVAQHQERKARLRDIMRALRRVWDQDFPYKVAFINKDDPKSTMKLQTERPGGAPNVTVYLDLDRTVQFSWTGYEGMKCMEDVEQFERVMREENQVEIEVVGPPVNRPSAPNPPFGGGSGPVFEMPTTPSQSQQKVTR